MAKYEPGDYVKVEFKGDGSGDSEWMWVKVDYSDDDQRLDWFSAGWITSRS